MKKAKEILKKLKLRPTLQRVAITEILLKKKEVLVFIIKHYLMGNILSMS